MLKEKLSVAMKGKDPEALEKVIEECVAAGMPELDTDIQSAQDILDRIVEGQEG